MKAHETTFPADEYEALQSGYGFVELTRWSSVSLTGADRQTFLNSFCTNDVKRLQPGMSCEAFFTNVKGKILGHGLVTCRDGELVIVTVRDQAPRLIEHFDRYVIREDVTLRDTTPERFYVLIASENAKRVDVIGETMPGAASFSWPLFDHQHAYLLEVAAANQTDTAPALLEHGGIRCGQSAFRACRIEAGLPLYGTDFDDTNLPQEIGRDAEAISFTKGCYLGQETVARIDALGHVNQRISGVRYFAQDVPAAGLELFRAGSNVGRVSSATFSPRLGAPLALAMVRRAANAVGTRLESNLGECEIVSLPLR